MPSNFSFSAGTAPQQNGRSIGQGNIVRHGTSDSSTSWTVGDTWSIAFTATLSGRFTIGAGRLVPDLTTVMSLGLGINYIPLLVTDNRAFIGFGKYFAFSDNSDVTGWEEQSPGSGRIQYISQFGFQDNVNALATFQGKLAVFGRYSIQIWTIDADPTLFAKTQTLANIGCVAPLSAQGLGDLDVIFLDDSGFRSLQTLAATLNAESIDIGTPIDSLVQASTQSLLPKACGIVEPVTKRYWCAIGTKIYVLSRFRSSKIIAWSTYDPQWMQTIAGSSYPNNVPAIITINVTPGARYTFVFGANDQTINNGTEHYVSPNTCTFIALGSSVTVSGVTNSAYTGFLYQHSTFTPERFVVFKGQIFVRDTTGRIFQYGGSNGVTFDYSMVTVLTPWLDGKAPAENKISQSLDAAIMGKWTISMGSDPASGSLAQTFVYGSDSAPSESTDASYDLDTIPIESQGTHFQLQFVSSGSCALLQKLSSFTIHYRQGQDD